MKRDLYGLWRNYTDPDEATDEKGVGNSTAKETTSSNRRRLNKKRLLNEIAYYTNETIFVGLTESVPFQIDASEA